MFREKLWENSAFYPTQILLSNSTINPGGIQSEKPFLVAAEPLLKPGFLLQLAMLLLLAAFFPGAKLHAQTGQITATVADPSGAAIPGAHVQIVNQATGDITRETTSDASGTFRALNIPAATYKIKVTASGMEELDRNNVVLDQDQSLGLGQLSMT